MISQVRQWREDGWLVMDGIWPRSLINAGAENVFVAAHG
jgi:hypothetical protein